MGFDMLGHILSFAYSHTAGGYAPGSAPASLSDMFGPVKVLL
jgi:hypothetical protein